MLPNLESTVPQESSVYPLPPQDHHQQNNMLNSLSPNQNLPEELIINILLRLPAKSIGRCRCVSKPWCSLLSTPQFIKAHLNNHVHDQEKLILISDASIFTLTFATGSSSSSSSDAVSKKLTFLQYQDEFWFSIAGSCNGLVLVVNDEERREMDRRIDVHCPFLVNPTTKEIVKLPENPFAPDPFDRHDYYCLRGFGYDSCSDDYKVVTLSYKRDDDHNPDCDDIFVDVYSVKMRSWRRLGNSPYDHSVSGFVSGKFINGAIHWLAFSRVNYSYVITAFDLNTEKFNDVPAPSTLDNDKLVLNTLVVLGGCLGMVGDPYPGYAASMVREIDVWTMKDYGVGESWTKFRVDGHVYIDLFVPTCLLGDEEVVLEKDSEELIAYNMTQKTSRAMVVKGISDEFDGEVMAFSESLVSLSFYSADEDQHN